MPLRCCLAALTSGLVAGCSGDLSSLDPAGPAARSIATLWWVMLAGAAVLFGLVMVLLAASFRSRRRQAGTAGGERLWIVGLGLVMPVIVLLALLAYGLLVGERLVPRQEAEAVRVAAEARRWAWTFSYGDAPGRTTENVLHIPAGRPVEVAVTSADVIHAFWVPRLAGKIDAIPGHVNVLRLEADRPGRYDGVSAEFAGPGYDGFGFAVEAHDAAGWGAFIGGVTP